ncbi:MAG: ABC transporter, substrate-binding protein (cluster 4, leucine/isoleucine/valine/benzoate) [Burkholderiaceae bacterium]|jgi:branched-chain amino acid transport system substrate-binding protein|nr:MAG: ABC transporter, substrate-binding protein (cluster 4, leucine/isoleucine/valine/benzoate) [Burkholderiaceae bacterium]
MKTSLLVGLFAAAAISMPAFAASPEPVVIGASIAQTGPASSLGAGEVKAINLLVNETNAKGGVAGHPLKVVILDSASDPQKSVLNVRKLVTEDNAVGVICCTTSPESMAILDTVQRAKVPNISLAASAAVVEPVAERHWIFKTPPLDATMVGAEVKDMQKQGLTSVGFLGFSDAYGQGGLNEFKKAAEPAGVKLVATEQFARTDTNLSSQATKLVAANPQAILIWAIPPGANVAQKALQSAGYKGVIYQSYGVTNETFLRLGGASLNGTRVSVLPVIVHDKLPASLPFKSVVEQFVKDYRAANGGETPSSFAGHAYDAVKIFVAVADKVLSAGKVKLSDTDAFRVALRDGIEHVDNFQAVDGTYNFSKDDHGGLGPSSAIMVTIENGGYQVIH